MPVPGVDSSIAFLITGIFSLIVAYMGTRVYWSLVQREEATMAQFQLDQDQTVNEFELLLFGSIALVSGGAIYMVGAILGRGLIMDIGVFMGVPIEIALMKTFHRWYS